MMLGERAWLRVVDALEGDGVERGTIFRSQGLRTEAGFFAFLNSQGMVLKLSSLRVNQLVASGGGEPFRSGERVMKEWVVVPRARSRTWVRLASEARRRG